MVFIKFLSKLILELFSVEDSNIHQLLLVPKMLFLVEIINVQRSALMCNCIA